MSLSLVDPVRLHQQAMQQEISIEAIPFAKGLTAGKRWAPESLVYFSYLPSRHLLDEHDMSFLAEFAALGICEQFIFLEGDLLIPAVENLLARRKDSLSIEFRHCLLDLVAEEHRHTEMFWRLLETARPEWYPERRTRIHHASRRELVRAMTGMPDTLLAWVWMGLLFEEITIHVYRQHRQDPAVDPLFTEVHRLHMLDETRHFRIEQHLLKELWDKASPAVRAFNVRLFGGIMARFTSPRSPLMALRLLLERSPRLLPHAGQLEMEVRALRHNEAFQRNFYSREAVPMTFAAMDAYPEMKLLKRFIPLYEPRSARDTSVPA